MALLRGINVGKSIQFPMKQLKILLESLGYSNVITYLNSGNALFESDESAFVITNAIESTLELTFGQRIKTLVKSFDDMVNIAQSIPPDWTNDTTQQTYVAYLFKEIATPNIIDDLPIKREFMSIFYQHECLIWNIKRENYNKSQITKLASHASYAAMTTRNANTARKLIALY